MMQVLITGVGDAFTRTSFGSSALIRHDDGFMLLDCPDPIHRVIAEAIGKAGWQRDVPDASVINDVLLTHLHGDHCNGLESFGFWRRHRAVQHGTALPRLHTTHPVLDRLWPRLAPAMDGAGGGREPGDPTRTLEEYYAPAEITPDRPNHLAGLTVRCRFTGHPVPTVGLLISDGRWTLGWSGDTPFEQAHIDWLSEADIIVHECNRGTPHTSLEELSGLPDALRRRIRLIHLPDDADLSGTDLTAVTPGDILSA